MLSSLALSNGPLTGTRWRQVLAALLVWTLYIACQTGYCLLHVWLFSETSYSLGDMLVWAVSEWSLWLVLTPWAFIVLSRCQAETRQRLIPAYLKLIAGTLAMALAMRAGFDAVTGTYTLLETLVIYTPRYLAALVGIVLIWHLFWSIRGLRNQRPPAANERTTQAVNTPVTYPDTLLVSKGRDECLIRVARIQSVTAAGNYVEVDCNNQTYLMRATMKQVEQQLPPSQFLRTHRSHIVNINAIERIKTLPSGNGLVHLRDGKVLGLGKKYRGQLQQYRL